METFGERLRVEVTSGSAARENVVRPRVRRNRLDLSEQHAHQGKENNAEGLTVLHHLGRHLNDVVLNPALSDADVLAGAQQRAQRPQKEKLLGTRHTLHDRHGFRERLPADGRTRGNDGRREDFAHFS